MNAMHFLRGIITTLMKYTSFAWVSKYMYANEREQSLDKECVTWKANSSAIFSPPTIAYGAYQVNFPHT